MKKEEKTAYLKEYYTVGELAELLKLNEKTVRQYIKNGYYGYKLRASLIGHAYYIHRDDLIKFMEHFIKDEA